MIAAPSPPPITKQMMLAAMVTGTFAFTMDMTNPKEEVQRVHKTPRH
jgi:hypothetical protein